MNNSREPRRTGGRFPRQVEAYLEKRASTADPRDVLACFARNLAVLNATAEAVVRTALVDLRAAAGGRAVVGVHVRTSDAAMAATMGLHRPPDRGSLSLMFAPRRACANDLDGLAACLGSPRFRRHAARADFPAALSGEENKQGRFQFNLKRERRVHG